MEKLIYDVGMHVGKDTEFYLKKGFKVIAIEAVPAFIKSAEEKFESELKSGQLIIINKAIADTDSPIIDFYINEEKNAWGTILPDWNRTLNSNFKKITVETIRFEEIIEKYGMPYYMKIDIEGADIICLNSLLKIGNIPEFLSVELMVPENLSNKNVDCLDMICLLSALGYKKFKISEQSKPELVKCPNPPLEGKYVDFSFSYESSGLFGNELLSKTYSLDEVARMYLEYFYQSRNKNHSLYSKILKKLRKSRNHTAFDSDIPWSWYDIHAIKG